MYLIADIWIHVIRMQARSFIHYNMIHDIFQADVSYPNICNTTMIKYCVMTTRTNSRRFLVSLIASRISMRRIFQTYNHISIKRKKIYTNILYKYLPYKYLSTIFINRAKFIDKSDCAHENQKDQDSVRPIGGEFLQADIFVHGFRSRRSSGSIQWLSALDSRSIRLVFVRAMATVSRPSLLQSRTDTRDS